MVWFATVVLDSPDDSVVENIGAIQPKPAGNGERSHFIRLIRLQGPHYVPRYIPHYPITLNSSDGPLARSV